MPKPRKIQKPEMTGQERVAAIARLLALGVVRLDDQTQQRLNAYVDEEARLNKREEGINRLLPGTVLIRQYKGEEHRVQVLHRGFEYQQVQYRSLTDVAKAITGNHCSGPMFFGLARVRKTGESR